MRLRRFFCIFIAAALLAAGCSAQATLQLPETAETASVPAAQAAVPQQTETQQSETQQTGTQQTGTQPATSEFLRPLPANRVAAPAIDRPPIGTSTFASTTTDAERIEAAYFPQTQFVSESYYHGEVTTIDVIDLDDGYFATTSESQIHVWQVGESEPVATADAGSGPSWKTEDGQLANVGTDGRFTRYHSDLQISQQNQGTLELDEIYSVLTRPESPGLAIGLGMQDESVVYWSLGTLPLFETGLDDRPIWNAVARASVGFGFGFFLQTGSQTLEYFDIWDHERTGPTVFNAPQPILRLYPLPDGRVVVPYEVGLDVWDVDAPDEPLHLAGPTEHTDYVVDLPDGTLATVATDDILRLWRLDQPADPMVAMTAMPYGGRVRGLVALDSGHLATVGYDKNVHVWDPTDLSAPVLTFEHNESLLRAEQLPDGRLAVLTVSSTFYVWDLDNPGAPLILDIGSNKFTKTISQLSDGTIFTASADGVARLFSQVDEQIPTSDNRWHTQQVSDIMWLTDGRLVSTGASGEMFLWDLSARRPPIELVGHEKSISMIAEHRGSLVSASADGSVRQWDLSSGDELTRIAVDQPIVAAQVLPDGAVAISGADGTLAVSRLDDPAASPLRVEDATGVIQHMRLLSDGRMVSANSDHGVTVWDTNVWQPVFTYTGHESAITAIEELPKGQLITGDESGAIHVWDPRDQQPTLLARASEGIRTIDVVGEGRFSATTASGEVKVWDVSRFDSPTGVDGMVAAVALSDGRIVGAGADNALRSWENIDLDLSSPVVSTLVTLSSDIHRIEAYDSERLAVATGQAIVIVDITD